MLEITQPSRFEKETNQRTGTVSCAHLLSKSRQSVLLISKRIAVFCGVFMRIRLIAVCAILSLLLGAAACGTAAGYKAVGYKGDIREAVFTDDAGRKVELPKEISRVAPSGFVATMILATLCPEYMVCVSSSPSSSQYKYLPGNLIELPTTGQLYGSKSTINFESLIKADPQIIIDLGDRKDSIASDMDALQRTTDIATIFLEADLYHISHAYRTLGKLLGLEEKAETLAYFIDETMMMAAKNSAKIADGDRLSVMYTSGTSGLNTNASGSTQAQVIEIIGAKNAVIVEEISNQGGGNIIGLEQLYNFDPEVILFTGGSIYSTVAGLEAWSGLSAVKNGKYYEIPYLPYNWMSNPPSVNMVVGVWWLGNLLYPDVYDYDIVAVARDFYKLFWGYDLTAQEAEAMLANSCFKFGIRN